MPTLKKREARSAHEEKGDRPTLKQRPKCWPPDRPVSFPDVVFDQSYVFDEARISSITLDNTTFISFDSFVKFSGKKEKDPFNQKKYWTKPAAQIFFTEKCETEALEKLSFVLRVNEIGGNYALFTKKENKFVIIVAFAKEKEMKTFKDQLEYIHAEVTIKNPSK